MAGKRKQAVRGRNGIPAWIWLVLGLVVGIGLASWVFLGGHAPQLRGSELPAAPAQTPEVAPEAAAPAEQPKEYDFYSILPEMEVVIPDAELSAKARNEASHQAGAPASPGRYVLQAGSFRANSDAEALKAKLALQGFVARVQSVTINGETWNRVRLGPYDSASQLEGVKDKLEAAGIHAIALKEN